MIPAAVALWCVAVLPLRLTELDGAAAIVQLAALVVVGAAAARATRRGVRRLESVRTQGWDRADASA